MPARPLRLSLLLVLLLGWPVHSGCAQQTDPATTQAALQSGNYETARAGFAQALDNGDASAAVGLAESYLAVGAYDEGRTAIEQRLAEAPEDPFLLHAYGRFLQATGNYPAALEAYQSAGQQQREFWQNMLYQSEVLLLMGQQRAGLTTLVPLYRAYRGNQLTTADALADAAIASARLEEFNDANRAFQTASRVDPQNARVLRAWANLFRAKYNDADATRTYQDALRINPNDAETYLGLAQVGQGFGQREQYVREALKHNPNHPDAHALLAGLRILDGLYDEALQAVDRALAVNPSHLMALGHLASVHYLRGDTTAYLATEERALAVTPAASTFYMTLAENANYRFRYPAAVQFAERAVAVDRRNPETLAALGNALMRVGATYEARRFFTASFDRDAFNLYVKNMLALIDGYEDFVMLEGPNVRLLIHGSESDVLGYEMLAEAERAYAALAERYPYDPPGKLTVEAYDDAADFGVRISGVPHLGLLGVSFGDVVALHTPRAKAGQPYNWARTLWHELAHTMAIGVSSNRVPRWFTEGLSVYEEQLARPEWGREMELTFFSALDAGRLLPLAEIDRGFTRPTFPGQIILSYYHASRVIGYIADTYGFEAIVATLQSLGEGQPIAESIEAAVGVDLATLDAAFRASLTAEKAQYAAVLGDVPTPTAEGEAANPLGEDGVSENPFFARLMAGQDALASGDDAAAETAFREAIDLYPNYVGPGNAYLSLARLYEERGDTAEQQAMLEAYLALSEHGVDAVYALADLYEAAGRTDEAAALLARSLQVDPYVADVHARLAAYYENAERYDDAVVHRRALLGLEPPDLAQAHFDLANALFGTDQIPDAKRAVLMALEQAPSFREAQRLLLQIVEREAEGT